MAYIYHYYAVIEDPRGDGRAVAEGLYRSPYPIGTFDGDYLDFRQSIKWGDYLPAWIQERKEYMEVRSFTFLGQTDDGNG